MISYTVEQHSLQKVSNELSRHSHRLYSILILVTIAMWSELIFTLGQSYISAGNFVRDIKVLVMELNDHHHYDNYYHNNNYYNYL